MYVTCLVGYSRMLGGNRICAPDKLHQGEMENKASEISSSTSHLASQLFEDVIVPLQKLASLGHCI